MRSKSKLFIGKRIFIDSAPMEETKQRDYLFEKGVIENGDSEEIVASKKDYQKKYQQTYHRAYKKQIVRKEIHLTKAENEQIKIAAKAHNMKVRPFIKSCLFSYLNKGFVGVDDEQLHTALVAISRVGNNINQIAHRLNRGDQMDQASILKSIYTKLDRLEEEVEQALAMPSTLEALFYEAVEKDARAVDRLEELLRVYRTQNK